MKTRNKIILNALIFFCLCLAAFGYLYLINPTFKLSSDSPSYIEAIEVLKSSESMVSGFVPNRIMTSFLGLQTLRFLSAVLGNYLSAWLLMNTLLYALAGLALYNLIFALFGSQRVALVGLILFATNYDIIIFGLNYLLDMGGWAFFTLALCFLAFYSKGKQDKYLWLSFGSIALGSLFKEYTFLALPSVLFMVFVEGNFSVKHLIKKAALPTILAFVPVALVHGWVFMKFDYNYLNWFQTNNSSYGYSNWIVNSIKSFGSVLNLLILFAVFGLKEMFSNYFVMDNRLKIFILSVFISILPIFVWPSITQRVIFTAVVPFIVLSSLAIKKYENKFLWLIPPLAAYIGFNYFMDPFIFNLVNLPV